MSQRQGFICILCLSITSIGWAGEFRYTFDADDFMNLFPTAPDTTPGSETDKVDQVNMRNFVWYKDSKWNGGITWEDCDRFSPTYDVEFYGNDSGGAATQPNAYNTYMNWRNGLTGNEGISKFNYHITPSDGPTYNSVLSAGQNLVYETGTGKSATGISATAPEGWTATVEEIYGGVYGVVWETTDSTYYLRPGNEINGLFSFTAPLELDAAVDGAGDRDLQAGDHVRMWFGSQSDMSGTDNVMHFDNVWGTGAPAYGPYGDTEYEFNFGADLDMTVQAQTDNGTASAVDSGSSRESWVETFAAFTNIAAGGDVTVDREDVATLPVGLPDEAIGAWDVTADGSFNFGVGDVKMSFDYTDFLSGFFGDEANLQLWHYDNGTWTNVTNYIDTDANLIYSDQLDGFSPFAVVPEPATMVLLGLGGLGLLRSRRKRRT